MKDNLRKKLRIIYGEPPEELEGLIHRQILSLPDSEGGEITMKKPIKLRIAIVIGILMGIMAIAYAATNWINLNWKGEEAENTPRMQETQNMDLITQMNNALFEVPDEYYGVVVSENSEDVTSRYKLSRSESLSVLDGIPLMRVPDISFSGTTEVELDFQCGEHGEYVLADEEENNGFTLRKYAIAPENEVVTGYLVQYWENEKVVKSIQSRLTPSKTHTFSFRAEGNVDTQVVTAPGMDEALWITRNGKTSLKMIRKLEQPVTVKAAPESSLGEFDGTIAYGYELITVNNFTFDECEQYFQVAIP
jgi:hypothetical protein